jgi:hypothetical protein
VLSQAVQLALSVRAVARQHRHARLAQRSVNISNERRGGGGFAHDALP